MQKFLNIMHQILHNGDVVFNERTQKTTYKVFGTQTRFNLNLGHPIPTTRFVPWEKPIAEMLWFTRGSTDVDVLAALGGGRIWDQWADEGSIGPMYGHVLRSIDVVTGQGENIMVDQLSDVLKMLKTDPTSRRILMTTLDIGKLPRPNLTPKSNVACGQGALMPCHGIVIQLDSSPFTSAEYDRMNRSRRINTRIPEHLKEIPHHANKLRLQVYVRSNDWPVGACWNISQYAALLMMIAREVDHHPYELVYTTGDTHIYGDQIEGAKKQLTRTPFGSPWLEILPDAPGLFDLKLEHFKMHNLEQHDKIVFPVAV